MSKVQAEQTKDQTLSAELLSEGERFKSSSSEVV